jgi:MSHA biogenesis protein MshL
MTAKDADMMRTVLVTLIAVVALQTPAPAQESAPPDVSQPAITLVTSGWVDVRELLRHVAEQAGLGLEIAPDVVGEVNTRLEAVPLTHALAAMLEPIGAGYEIADGVLIVSHAGLQTRWFTFDYPVTKRQGKGELQVSARRSNSQSSNSSSGGVGSGQSSDENRSNLSTSSTMDIWPQVIAALQTVVFEAENPGGAPAADAEALAISLSDSTGRVLVVNAMAGLVQVTAEWSRIRRVESLLARLEESLRRQVAIEVQILEVTLRDTDKVGIDWSNVTGEHVDIDFQSTQGLESPVLNLVLKNSNTTALLEAISQQGTVKVLSTPRISTLNNQKAVVRVVTEEVFYEAQVEPAIVTNGVATEAVVNYTPQVIPVGIVLDVTPQVGQDRVVTLNVHPTISDIVRISTSPNEDTQPVLAVRELDTVGQVRDGETLIIAGLIDEGERTTVSGVPFLMNLPFVGAVFRSTDRQKTSTELVMLLTPVIMDGQRAQEEAAAAEKRLRDKM